MLKKENKYQRRSHNTNPHPWRGTIAMAMIVLMVAPLIMTVVMQLMH